MKNKAYNIIISMYNKTQLYGSIHVILLNGTNSLKSSIGIYKSNITMDNLFYNIESIQPYICNNNNNVQKVS